VRDAPGMFIRSRIPRKPGVRRPPAAGKPDGDWRPDAGLGGAGCAARKIFAPGPAVAAMSAPRLKVLMMASSYPRAAEDTASIFLRYLAESLARRSHDIQVLVPAEAEGGVRLEGNVRVHRFRYLPAKWQTLAYGSGIMPNLRRAPWLWAEVPFFTAAMTAALFPLLPSDRPDVLHAHWLLPQGLVALPAKYFFGVPVVTSAHGTD